MKSVGLLVFILVGTRWAEVGADAFSAEVGVAAFYGRACVCIVRAPSRVQI